MTECSTCGGFGPYRPTGHAFWCWIADPSQPFLGSGSHVVPTFRCGCPDCRRVRVVAKAAA